MDDKLLVTNRTALLAKYGRPGLDRIRRAVGVLATADRKRGIQSRLVYLDDAAAMRAVGGVPVKNPTDPRQNKNAIDAVFRSLAPDYLVLLGAPDVVPHQDLTNPAFSPPDDDDAPAWGDVPYACDAPYSRDPARFVGPTRVVGRLPDLVAATEPSHLLALLKTAARYRSRPPAEYARYFGLSARVWQGSSRMSLDQVFGNADHLHLAPPAGPAHPDGALGARMHFINCHGGRSSPEFQGQQGQRYPVSLTTATTLGEIVEGTVAAVECCYGGELYDSITLGIDGPICQSYLRQGAYGYLGSTTIAYGPADDNGAADLICQFFLLNVLDGASLGRAALMARQQFVARASQMDPVDLKTLAQFCLLGDPSVHPVAVAGGPGIPKGVPVAAARRFLRGERRAKLRLTGEFLRQTKPVASRKLRSGRVSAASRAALAGIARRAGLGGDQKFTAFAVRSPPAARGRAGKSASAPSRYHVAIGTPPPRGVGEVRHGVAVVAKELDGRIVGYRIYQQRRARA